MARQKRIQRNDAIYLVSNRCFQERCLLTPSPEVNAVCLGTLAHSAHKHHIKIFGYIFMPNAFFLVVQAPYLNLGKFMRDFQSPLARDVNRLRKRRGKFFRGRYACERILDGRAFWERLGWMLNKPCTEDWVEHADQWPGVSSRRFHTAAPAGTRQFVCYLNRKKLRALRRCQKDSHGVEELPAYDFYHLTVQPPPEFSDLNAHPVKEVAKKVTQMANAAAVASAVTRNEEARACVGLKALEAMSWSARLDDVEPHKPELCYTCRDELRKDFETEVARIFITYSKAMARHLKRHPRPGFPPGTFRPGFPSCEGAPAAPMPLARPV